MMVHKRILALRPSNERTLHILFMHRRCARLPLPVCLKVEVMDECQR